MPERLKAILDKITAWWKKFNTISGHGSWLISGYNTASKEEKAKYNEKKLCRTMGIGMSVIAILLLIMGVFENILPAFFVYIALGIILADVVIIIVLGNTICRR